MWAVCLIEASDDHDFNSKYSFQWVYYHTVGKLGPTRLLSFKARFCII